MSRSSVNALSIAHEFLARNVKPGALCIDATAGRGGDTAFLCSLTGPRGRVLAFDIQREALDSTLARVQEEGYAEIARVIADSHANLSAYAEPGSVDGICFNFGWLPGGDHEIHTEAASSVEGVRQGLELLKPGGVMTLCLYYGRECGFGERDALLEYLSTVDFRRYTVLSLSFLNRPNNPPIPVLITRDG